MIRSQKLSCPTLIWAGFAVLALAACGDDRESPKPVTDSPSTMASEADPTATAAPDEGTQRVYVGLEEGCPHDWESIIIRDSVTTHEGSVGKTLSTTYANLPGVAETYNLPESNDCQRFLEDSPDHGAPFDSLFAIFSVDLEGLPQRAAEVEGQRMAVVAAQIFTPGGRYTPLAIEADFSCVYMWGGPRSWKAAVLPMGGRALNCADVSLQMLPPDQHLVVVETDNGTGPQDYPNAARWEWDGTGYRIGLRCGDAWCEIATAGGEDGGASVAPVSSLWRLTHAATGQGLGSQGNPWTAGSAQAMRAFVKGWYDEQILDVPNTGSGPGSTMSSGVRGYVVPDPQIANLTLSQYEDEWQTSAYVWLEAGIDEYVEKLNFGFGDRTHPNVVAFCRRGPRSCGVAAARLDALGCDVSPDGHTWYARITSAGPDSELGPYRCVMRYEHPGAEVPATARWRGVEADAKMWSRCAQGCCTVS